MNEQRRDIGFWLLVGYRILLCVWLVQMEANAISGSKGVFDFVGPIVGTALFWWIGGACYHGKRWAASIICGIYTLYCIAFLIGQFTRNDPQRVVDIIGFVIGWPVGAGLGFYGLRKNIRESLNSTHAHKAHGEDG